MKLNHKIKIDLKEFILQGKFDHLKLGMTKDKVLTILPEPEGWNSKNGFRKASAWVYGDFELYFQEDKLYMIFTDHLNTLNGGEYLEIDRWIFESGKKIILSEFVLLLIDDGIDFQKKTNVINQVILEILGADVYISFDKQEEPTYFAKAQTKDLSLPSNFELGSFHKGK